MQTTKVILFSLVTALILPAVAGSQTSKPVAKKPAVTVTSKPVAKKPAVTVTSKPVAKKPAVTVTSKPKAQELRLPYTWTPPKERLVTLESPGNYRLLLSNFGGTIQKIEMLKKQFKSWDTGKLKNLATTSSKLFNQLHLGFSTIKNFNFPDFEGGSDDEVKFLYFRVASVSKTSVVFIWPPTDDAKVYIVKRFSVDKGYQFHLSVSVYNLSKQTLTMKPFLTFEAYEPKFGETGGLLDPNPDVQKLICYDTERRVPDKEDVLQHVRNEKKGKSKTYAGIQWAGIDAPYFLTAILPRERAQCELFYDDSKNTKVATAKVELIKATILEAKEHPCYPEAHPLAAKHNKNCVVASKQFDFGIYTGPKDLDELKRIGGDLDRAIDFGWFRVLCEPILWLLKRFQGWVINWGIAIILLTLFFKIITLYWTQKSMKSMHEMQKLKPKMDELKERYGHDKQRLNQEMIGLYKTHKINPLSGCLPMLIQMPIWFALYRTLYSSVELYQAPLALWIHDLSARDPYYVLPVLLGGVMFVQQKLSTTTMDNAQAKMMLYAMPAIFTVLMAFLPAGLVLYIFVSTILSIVHHLYLNRQRGEEAIVKAKI